MNKKGVSKLLWYIFELLIAGLIIIIAIYFINKFFISGSQEEDLTKVYFEELNNKIEKLGINQETEQLMEFKDNDMLISFNDKKDATVNVKLKGSTIESNFLVKVPSLCTKKGCLCLCKTENKNYPIETDCIGSEDLCKEYEQEITNDKYTNSVLFILEKGIKTLKIKRASDNINLNF